MRPTGSFGVGSKRARVLPGVHLGPQAFWLNMERCRVTPERIEVACRVAVDAVLTQVAKITGVACDAQVQCVFNQYGKGKRNLEFSWSIDGAEPLAPNKPKPLGVN